MTKSIWHFTLSLFILLLSLALSSTSSSHHEIETLHFTLYEHDIPNKDGYIIVNGVAGANITNTTLPLGTIYAFQDPMTLKPNRTSKVVGIAEGSFISSSFNGLTCITSAKLTLNFKNYKGSIIVIGGTHNVKPSTLIVVGGTGDFMFVQGHVIASNTNFVGVFKIDFYLFWPPYADQVRLSQLQNLDF